eukprot:GHVN01079386.1.p2 GENE.GHVN01079386.1~~GHVN01079386.1.p2  ORF type:complete len:368 (+),score=55.27 GHVN01079386.1:1550-2653(+)
MSEREIEAIAQTKETLEKPQTELQPATDLPSTEEPPKDESEPRGDESEIKDDEGESDEIAAEEREIVQEAVTAIKEEELPINLGLPTIADSAIKEATEEHKEVYIAKRPIEPKTAAVSKPAHPLPKKKQSMAKTSKEVIRFAPSTPVVIPSAKGPLIVPLSPSSTETIHCPPDRPSEYIASTITSEGVMEETLQAAGRKRDKAMSDLMAEQTNILQKKITELEETLVLDKEAAKKQLGLVEVQCKKLERTVSTLGEEKHNLETKLKAVHDALEYAEQANQSWSQYEENVQATLAAAENDKVRLEGIIIQLQQALTDGEVVAGVATDFANNAMRTYGCQAKSVPRVNVGNVSKPSGPPKKAIRERTIR